MKSKYFLSYFSLLGIFIICGMLIARQSERNLDKNASQKNKSSSRTITSAVVKHADAAKQ